MSRLSSRPRDSLFAGGQSFYRDDNFTACSPNLLECVNALQEVNAEVHEAQHILRNGTFDLPRMSRILDNQRAFLLIDERTVRQYQAELTDEVEPQILELIERARNGLEALERRQKAVAAKAEQGPKPPTRQTASDRIAMGRLRMLTAQRQRLEQELAELQKDVKELED